MAIKLRLLIAAMLFSFHSIAMAYWPSVGECYEIDGPANIRDAINGKSLLSLNSRHKVRILEVHDSGWFKITFSPHPNICGSGSIGWTYKYNLKPLARDIIDLVESDRARFIVNDDHYPRPSIYYDEKMKGVWLFGEFQSMDAESGQELTLSNPMLLNQYCDDGSQIVNELISVYLDYGGDSGVYSPRFNFKKKTSSACLTVNGSIIDLEQNIESKVTQPYCEILVKEGKEEIRKYWGQESSLEITEKTVSCDYIKFPFQLGSSKLSITKVNYNVAPSFHRWDLWVDNKRYELGQVGIP